MGGHPIGNDNKRRRQEPLMTQRQRKAAGTVLTILALIVWAAIGMWIHETWLVEAHNLVHLAFFVLFGLAWVFPAMMVIRWMARPDS